MLPEMQYYYVYNSKYTEQRKISERSLTQQWQKDIW